MSRRIIFDWVLITIGASLAACSSSGGGTDVRRTDGTAPGGCAGSGDCSGASPGDTGTNKLDASSSGSPAEVCTDCRCAGNCDPTDLAKNGVKEGTETDIDCGGPERPKCAEGKSCAADSDCDVTCSEAKRCILEPSCKPHLGGDTCGIGEVGEPGAVHESCCKSLLVAGYEDPAHPGKKVYLDKYEITAGRVRAWIAQLAASSGGKPDVRGWIAKNRPAIWDPAWDDFLPTDDEGGQKTIGRRLLGDPRPEDEGTTGNPGPGVILPPATDQVRHMGTNYQFGSEIYVDLHGNNCATWDGTYGSPTFWYPPEILERDHQVPRADGLDHDGKPVPAKEALDVKAMNCITNAMLAAFCAWDGGQLATDEVLDSVTATPKTLANTSGCGTQIDNHSNLLHNDLTGTVQEGGRCAKVLLINATFDAGDNLPVSGSPLNVHNYFFPDFGDAQTSDKSWQISAPGRATFANFDYSVRGQQVDAIRLRPDDEPWMDLGGNVGEAALDMSGATFTGNFSLKYRGIGYGSARSDLNTTKMKGEDRIRIQRPEAKASYTGGRCMRFK